MAPYRFAYDPPTVRAGTGATDALGDELERIGCERALLVTGRSVGANDAVMEPIREGLDDRLVGEFAETTPEKRLGTAIQGRAEGKRLDADAIVGVGGGSSLDVAKLIAALYLVERPATAGAELQERGTLAIPEGPLPPVVTVPTTLAGAELSRAAGVTADPEDDPVDAPVSAAISDDRLMPTLTCYDPRLFAATPVDILCGSAMNGFDKGIESLYAQNRTPITDATASEGLARLTPALHVLRDRSDDLDVLERLLEGLVLVQYGASRPDGTTLSLIHAFGHGLSRRSAMQQGVAHAVMAPHVLGYVLTRVDEAREQLARALGVPRGADRTRAIVDEVTAVRDALDLPTRLRDVEGGTSADLEAVAARTADDDLMANCPPELAPTVDDLVKILEAAY